MSVGVRGEGINPIGPRNWVSSADPGRGITIDINCSSGICNHDGIDVSEGGFTIEITAIGPKLHFAVLFAKKHFFTEIR